MLRLFEVLVLGCILAGTAVPTLAQVEFEHELPESDCLNAFMAGEELTDACVIQGSDLDCTERRGAFGFLRKGCRADLAIRIDGNKKMTAPFDTTCHPATVETTFDRRRAVTLIGEGIGKVCRTPNVAFIQASIIIICPACPPFPQFCRMHCILGIDPDDCHYVCGD